MFRRLIRVRQLLAFVAILAAAGLVAPGLAHATPPDLFGFGGRSPGLAFTGAANADDYEAAFLNPAGLARATDNGLYLGLAAGTYQLDLDGSRFPAESAQGMTIGFTLPLPFGDVLEDRLVIGGGFYTPSGVLLAGTINLTTTPQFDVLERVQASAIIVGLGMDFHDWIDGFRIGASVNVAADLVGDLFVFLDETNAFSSVIETQLITVMAPILGASYERDNYGFGLTYRFELKGIMNLAISASDLPIEIPEFFVGGIVHYDPAALVAEGFWRPVDDLTLNLQLQTRFWNNYPGPAQQVTETSDLPPAPDYAPTVAPRIGAEWGMIRGGKLNGDLRLGYAFEPTPAGPARMVPQLDSRGNQTGELVPLRFVDNHRHVATAGFGFAYEFSDGTKLTADLYGQLHILMNRTHEIGATDGAPPMQTSGTMVAGGWVFGLMY